MSSEYGMYNFVIITGTVKGLIHRLEEALNIQAE